MGRMALLLTLLFLAACTGHWLARDGMRPRASAPADTQWTQYPIARDTIHAAPDWTRKDFLTAFLDIAVWNASGRRADAANCFGPGDPFACLLHALADGRPARIAVGTFATDSMVGWGAAVAPDRTLTIFTYDSSPCGGVTPAKCGYSLRSFQCKVAAPLERRVLSQQRTLCSQPHFGLDRK